MQTERESSPRIHRCLSFDFEFRLVILLPSPDFESQIECRLEHAILGQCQPYEALSYVWGKPEFTQPILLDSQEFTITPNLESALRHLRRQGEERTLWIDAICINQEDLAERREQVGYMRRIYSHCSSDICWLGAEDAQFTRGMEIIRTLQGFNIKQIDSLGWGSDEWDQVHGYAINRLLSYCSIWTRVWVMQEIACSPRVILTCGTETLDWSLVEAMLDGGQYYTDAFHMSFSHSVRSPLTESLSRAKFITTQREIMAKIQEGEESRLLDVLARFRHTVSTDPRDKVYGLLGLVSDTLGVEADYTKSVVETYVGVTLALINSSANLDILCQCPWKRLHMDRQSEGLPNWVPDFSSREDGRYLFAQRGIYSPGRPTCSVPCKFRESGTILVNGFFLGRLRASKGIHISETSAPWEKVFQVTIRDWYQKNLGSVPPQYHTGENQVQAFWRTLVADCKGYPQQRLTPDDIAHDHMRIQELLSPDKEESPLTRAIVSRMQSYKILAKLIRQERWRFFISVNGLFVLALEEASEGDVLVVLDGAKTPMVLRPMRKDVDGNVLYQPISGAYVHGFMDGEVLELEHKFEEQAFRLI
ncbi:HET-domain-containing protein [Lentithecium fluviatile CBS 122367]|uniref:HET-domain-containing protein n=1 Tax=Lentithecium fluviatile CBS 122367 TaxID=1168545 RepID=A0A6G1J274_9PLEO|nr:HET-domain-containing protein [Lentithecium fluviatile CBS 122367]